MSNFLSDCFIVTYTSTGLIGKTFELRIWDARLHSLVDSPGCANPSVDRSYDHFRMTDGLTKARTSYVEEHFILINKNDTVSKDLR